MTLQVLARLKTRKFIVVRLISSALFGYIKSVIAVSCFICGVRTADEELIFLYRVVGASAADSPCAKALTVCLPVWEVVPFFEIGIAMTNLNIAKHVQATL